MLQMLPNTKLRMIVLSALRLLLIFSIGFPLASCETAPKFPTKKVWESDIRNLTCGEYEIVDQRSSTFRLVKDHPLQKCDGVFGFSTEDMPKVLTWKTDMMEYAEKRCK